MSTHVRPAAAQGITLLRPALMAVGAIVVVTAQSGWAQGLAAADYPNRPIRLVVPFVAGGPMDLIGRLVGQKLQGVWGQNLLIDNRAGAGGIIGSEFVAKAPPDGYTMLHMSSAHALLPAFNKLPYDPVRDFAPVSTATRTVGYVLGVHPSVPAHSVHELIGLAKKNPGKLNYGNSGIGGVLHVGMEMFNAAAGISMTTVQYKGIGNLVNDLAGGHIDLSFLTSSNALGLVRGGKVRPLGISGKSRWKQLPDVPTLDEAGLKGFEYYAWFGFWYPARTPHEIIAKFHTELVRAVGAADVVQRFDEVGFEAYTLKPEEFDQLVRTDIAATQKLAQRLGFKAQ